MSKLFHSKNSKDSGILFESWSLSRTNYVLFASGLVFIIFGYVIMSTGEVNSFQSLTLAPIMLFIGYIILIPAALIYRDRTLEKN